MVKRERYIDIAKGVGILLMIFGHTMGTINKLHIWIYSFHMPLFFIIGGILMYEKFQDEKYSVGRSIGKELGKMGFPYLFWGCVLIVFYTALNIVSHQPLQLSSRIVRLISLRGIDSLWFLPAYFLSMSLFKLTKKNLPSRIVIAAFAICGIFLFRNINEPYMDVPYKVLLGYIFIMSGYYMKAFNFDQIGNDKIWLNIILFLLGLDLAFLNGPVEMTVGSLGNPVLFLICAMITSLCVVRLSKRLEKKSAAIIDGIIYYGKNSMILLVTNNLIIECIRLLDFKLTGNLLFKSGFIGSVIFTVMILLIEWVIIKHSNGRLSVLFGK